jgi:hypothetical protein
MHVTKFLIGVCGSNGAPPNLNSDFVCVSIVVRATRIEPYILCVWTMVRAEAIGLGILWWRPNSLVQGKQ